MSRHLSWKEVQVRREMVHSHTFDMPDYPWVEPLYCAINRPPTLADFMRDYREADAASVRAGCQDRKDPEARRATQAWEAVFDCVAEIVAREVEKALSGGGPEPADSANNT